MAIGKKKEFLIMWIGFIIPLTLLARDYKAKNASLAYVLR